ncbi:hypothetical protein Q0N68_13720, partial [Staphylococcus aureus]|nr:hypothetical protein [Staphylococcus aureus]
GLAGIVPAGQQFFLTIDSAGNLIAVASAPPGAGIGTGVDSTQVGVGARASAEDAVAVGNSAVASAVDATAVGTDAQALSPGATAIGAGAIAS